MSDANPNDDQPGLVDDLMAIKNLHPDAVNAVLTMITGYTHTAEQTYTEPKMGAVKKQFVQNQAASVFEQVADAFVDAASLIPGFPVPLAGILKSVVIPALPSLIDQIVHGLNASGIFRKH